MIKREHALPLSQQCRLLNLSRSSLYYDAVAPGVRDLELMRLIDEIHLKWPFYGSRRIRDELKDLGHDVGRGHVGTLMRKMGLEAIYCKPRTTKPQPGNKTYPYLVRNMEILRANHVWAGDITYLPMARGFCYLVAIMDWGSRRVLAWRLSNTLDVSFCLEALEEALAAFDPPEIFNTDQGSQFASEAFTDMLGAQGVKISMDGKGRWIDNVFIERLWRSVKYEEVYLKAYGSMAEARQGLGTYFEFYNGRRRHQNLGRRTPNEVYWGTLAREIAA
jgi:putative transposase